MAKNHSVPGKVISITASGANIASGELVKVGDLVAVALGAIPDGKTGEGAIEEVFTVPKLSSDNMGKGVIVYLDATNKRVTLNADSGTNIRAGKTFDAAGAATTTVRVKLNA